MPKVKIPKPRVPHLETHFVAGIKTFLERRKEEIEKRRESLKKQDPFFVEGRLNENEPTEDAAEQEGHRRVEALTLQIDRLLIQIKKALARIGVGKYGICEECKKPIDKARLEAMPMANLCVDCERKRSRGTF